MPYVNAVRYIPKSQQWEGRDMTTGNVVPVPNSFIEEIAGIETALEPPETWHRLAFGLWAEAQS